MSHQPLSQGPFGVRRTSGQQEVQSTAQTIDVGTCVNGMAVECLFGCKVIGSSQNFFVVADRQRIFTFIAREESCQTEIQNLDDAIGIYQQVSGLHIAMNHPGFVSIVQPQGSLSDEFGGIKEGTNTLLLNQFLQAVAFDVLHHQEVNFGIAVNLVIDVVSSNDIGMIERRNRLGFAVKSGEVRRVVHSLGRKYFQGTATAHQDVFGEKNRTHSPFSEKRQQSVFSQEVTFVLPLQQLISLPACHSTIGHQEFGKLMGIVGDSACLSILRDQSLQTVRFYQTALLEHCNEGLDI